LLLHEQIHVLQRLRPELFLPLYKDLLGFRQLDTVPQLPEDLKARHVFNPDGTDIRWYLPVKVAGHEQLIWPLLLFQGSKLPLHLPQDMQMAALQLQPEERSKTYGFRGGEDGRPLVQELFAVEEYVERLGGPGSIYHPAEASADLFAQIVVSDHFSKSEGEQPGAAPRPKRRYDRFRSWFRAAFQESVK
jgi:hypothetical protein